MRTTVTLEKDVAAALDNVRRERGLGLSEAVNDLIRKGLLYQPPRKRFVQKAHDMGEPYVDLTNIGRALEELEGPFHK
ncbi:MAG: ribbon-helix-helix protein, CopG family [Gaiellaceae bacterium MAG52_C11]|nr:ribbon-helix-helix protein, CopG family [Candidatus Gaiellasilicea maunaloa]